MVFELMIDSNLITNRTYSFLCLLVDVFVEKMTMSAIGDTRLLLLLLYPKVGASYGEETGV